MNSIDHPSSSKIEYIETLKLNFDPENPRFYRLNDQSSIETVIEEMLNDEGVQDLMNSIGHKGYFEGEPLLVIKEGSKLTVVEGNRRLAAVKLLNQQLSPPPKRRNSIKQIREDADMPPATELPFILYENRRDVMRYLGYRHITGIKEWDSLSKAKYLAYLRGEFYNKLSIKEQLRALSKDIGSTPSYVGKLLTALGLHERAEANEYFKLPMSNKDVVFSYITTAIGYAKITEWLALSSPKDIEMKDLDMKNLKKLFSWMFVKDQQGHTIIGESRKLSEVAAIVADTEAVEMLENTGSREEAFLYSSGPQEALNKALNKAGKSMQAAWNLLLKTDPLTEEHLYTSEDLFGKVKDIRNHIRNKLDD